VPKRKGTFKVINENLIAYAVKEFEVALRDMFANDAPIHTFRLTDGPPVALNLIITLMPSEVAEYCLDEFDKQATAAMSRLKRHHKES
jgi:hypothetical protein